MRRLLAPMLFFSLALPLHAQTPRSVEDILKSGERLMEEKNYDQALDEYRAALELDPASRTALYNLGWIYNEQKKFDTAARLLKEAVEKHPGDSPMHNEYGFALYKLANAEGAIAAYTRSTQVNPQSANAWLGLGDVYYELKKDSAQAARAYAKAVENGAQSPTPLYRLGWCYNDLGRHAEALPVLEKAAQLRADVAPIWTELGYTLLRLKKGPEAVTALKRSLALDGKQALTHLYLGRAYLLTGEKDKVRAQVQSLRALDSAAAAELEAEFKKK